MTRHEENHSHSSEEADSSWLVLDKIGHLNKKDKSNMNIAQAAKEMEEVAQKYRAEYDGLVSKKIIDGDVLDLLSISDLLKAGKIREAHEEARNLDTIVRDQIPETVWLVLNQEE